MPGRDPSELEDDIGITGNDDGFSFNGVDGLGHQDFLQKIRHEAFKKGKTRDNIWMADLTALHLSGEALTWFETLPDDVQQTWKQLKKAIIQKYGGQNNDSALSQSHELYTANNTPPRVDSLLPARIHLASWDTPALASAISFPKSEKDWLGQGRQRKWNFGWSRRVVYWHLVEPSDPIPDNAISAGTENGVTFYSIRAWYEGGLALGKLSTQGLFWSTKRVWITWRGREIPWTGSFEVLVGDCSAVRWIKPQASGPFDAVEGGFEAQNPEALLVVHLQFNEVVQPEEIFSGNSSRSYGSWSEESRQRSLHVLAWAREQRQY
ncbi:hypothetical protein FRC01_006616 [Tulasnella sp. 417]|nr:hypothetical protein FRC01_006616 [Tulasnella sp. 417]